MSQRRNFQKSRKQEAEPSSLDEEECCAICLEPLRNVAGTSSCSHTFCLPCLTVYAEEKRECPICLLEFDEIIFPERKKPENE
ncbi:hypothetical protein CEXT_671821 [Caerostris extrusa]|uniref:RING-type E3 ubiquitin transferase n=1 Tax=Caerostris extrusa TaxID=172846 RepID=A0AAV4XKL0_CAEEX|nr:hypothetical protein CEXT_671821 [Caerostris extrusa]